MYQQTKPKTTTLKVNKSYEGETIEQKVQRITSNNEPITDGAPIIYTERKDGVRPEMDIRTDRFELAVDAMDKVAKSKLAERDQRQTEREAAKVVKLNKEQDKGKDAPSEGAESGNPK